MDLFKIGLFYLFVLSGALGGNFFISTKADAKEVQKKPVRGDCGKISCDQVVKELRSLYPTYLTEYEQACISPNILAVQIYSGELNDRRALFMCWEVKVEKDKSRYGSSLGILPFPSSKKADNVANFLAPLPSPSPYTQELKTRYPKAITQGQFECATKGGNLLLEPVENNRVQLQCFFQNGVILIDENSDFKSDGEVSRGAGADVILGTFPIGSR
jgi:hypothetical protein